MSAAYTAAMLASNTEQVRADQDPGTEADLATLGYVVYNSTDYIPAGPSDVAVAVRPSLHSSCHGWAIAFDFRGGQLENSR